jgi:Mitochondrial ribosomal death-associated protein 3
VNSSTPYSYDLRTQTYLQPDFAQQTLQRFRSVNEYALSSLVTEDKIELDNGSSLPQGTALLKLIDVGLKERTSAPTVLNALLEALGKQTRFVHLLICFAMGSHDHIVEYLYSLRSMTSKPFSRRQHTKPHISRRFARGTYPCLASFSNMRAVVKHL